RVKEPRAVEPARELQPSPNLLDALLQVLRLRRLPAQVSQRVVQSRNGKVHLGCFIPIHSIGWYCVEELDQQRPNGILLDLPILDSVDPPVQRRDEHARLPGNLFWIGHRLLHSFAEPGECVSPVTGLRMPETFSRGLQQTEIPAAPYQGSGAACP